MNLTQEKNQIEKIDSSAVKYKEAYTSNHIKFLKLGDWLEKESSIFKNEAYNKNLILKEEK